MSPAQLAQIRLRLDQVAQQRAQAEAKQAVQHFARVITKAVSVPKGATASDLIKSVTDKPVTHGKSVREKPAKSSAARVAKHRASNLDAVRAKDRARKGAKGADRG